MNELVEYVLGKSAKVVDGKTVFEVEAIEALNKAGVKFTFSEQGVRWTLNNN